MINFTDSNYLHVSNEKFPEAVRAIEELIHNLERREADFGMLLSELIGQEMEGVLDISIRNPYGVNQEKGYNKEVDKNYNSFLMNFTV